MEKLPKIYKWIKVLTTYLEGFDTPTSSYTCNPGMAHIQLSSAPPKGFYYPKGTTPSFIPLPKTGPGTWMNQSSVTHYLPSQKIGRDTWTATWRTRDLVSNGERAERVRVYCWTIGPTWICTVSLFTHSCPLSQLYFLLPFSLWLFGSPTKFQPVMDRV